MSEEAWEQQWPHLGPQAQHQAGAWFDTAQSRQVGSQDGGQEGLAGADSPQAQAELDAAGPKEGHGQADSPQAPAELDAAGPKEGHGPADRAAAAAGGAAAGSPAGEGDRAVPAGAGSAAVGSPLRQELHPPPWAAQAGWEDLHKPVGQQMLSTSPASRVSGMGAHSAGPALAQLGSLTAAAAAPSSGGVEVPAEAGRQRLVKPQPR